VTLTDDIVPLAFIAGPAILANACAILQNGAALRHNLAVAQWRDFHASLVARDERIHALYVDVGRAVRLSPTVYRSYARLSWSRFDRHIGRMIRESFKQLRRTVMDKDQRPQLAGLSRSGRRATVCC
jgi:hypothetical protein